MLRKHLVIVGGGWAGLSLARNLKNINKNNLRITLISDDANFRYSPGLYRVATGHRERETIIPIGEVTADLSHVTFVKARATKINRGERTITVTNGQKFHYDYAVFALGSVTSYFGIPGVEEYSFGINSVKELHVLRTHIHKVLMDDKRPDKNYVIVGAGPTGVELASAMTTYIKLVIKRHGLRQSNINVELIEAAPRVTQMLQPHTSKKILRHLRSLGIKVHLNSKVEAETASSLQFNGRSIPTKTVIWTAGMVNNPFFKQNNGQFNLNERGKVVVDESLRVDDHTYVIGDNAATQHSGLALTAVHNAKFVANDIKKRLRGDKSLRIYKPLTPASIIPVGSHWAIMQYKNIHVSGRLGAMLRVVADFIGYIDVLGVSRGIRVMTLLNMREETCSVCRTALDRE